MVSNSWGMFDPAWDFPVGHPGNYSDNPNHPFNIIVARQPVTWNNGTTSSDADCSPDVASGGASRYDAGHATARVTREIIPTAAPFRNGSSPGFATPTISSSRRRRHTPAPASPPPAARRPWPPADTCPWDRDTARAPTARRETGGTGPCPRGSGTRRGRPRGDCRRCEPGRHGPGVTGGGEGEGVVAGDAVLQDQAAGRQVGQRRVVTEWRQADGKAPQRRCSSDHGLAPAGIEIERSPGLLGWKPG